MKRITALLLSLCMILCLCACGGSEIEYYENDGETADVTQPAADAPAAAPEIKMLEGPAFDAFPGDMVVGTVNGENVTWTEYNYWLYYYTLYVNQLAAQYGVALTSWDANELSSSMTNGEVVMNNAMNMVVQHHAVQTKADELGVTLNADEQAVVTQVFEQNADVNTGDGDGVCTPEEAAAFEAFLVEQHVDKAFFDYLNETSLLSEALFKALYGELGADCPEADIMAWVEENGVLSAKHILLLTVDNATRQPLGEDVAAEKLAKAEELLAQLQAVAGDTDALIALFDELTAANTEDTGYISNPDGYVFGPGEMVAEFENGTKALNPNYGLSGIVESSYGYHIILRQPITPESIVGTNSNGEIVNVRSVATSNLFNDDMTAWLDGATATWGEGFDDTAVLFG